jgi:hypothetical protein
MTVLIFPQNEIMAINALQPGQFTCNTNHQYLDHTGSQSINSFIYIYVQTEKNRHMWFG